eukprot:TRINITY_DN160_c0_g1_i1.p1 TRINITY_DN160_c0_g1~~TRINITY_DN160_c0_g1_i1.p1  ORF type:complete len:317 (+),score=99.55 TRINITY_DN160_c0_g1_i1:2153-3103(+)
MSEQWSMQVTPTEMYQQNSADLNYDYPLHHYPPPPPVECYPPTFHFDVNSYPNLPPAPNDLFTGYPQVYPPVPHPSISQGHQQMFPPSLSEYPSNGAYPWGESPPSAALSPPLLPVPADAAEDQQLPGEMFGMFDTQEGYGACDGYEGFYRDLQFANSSNLAAGPYSDTSPPATLVKPSQENPADPEGNEDGEFGDDESVDMRDLEDQLPRGVTENHLLTLKIPDLNRLLKDLELNREDQNLVKKIRRQYKNRGYANTCRKKKEEKKCSMKVQKQSLQVEINGLKDDVERLKLERDQYKRNYEIMQQTKSATLRRH